LRRAWTAERSTPSLNRTRHDFRDAGWTYEEDVVLDVMDMLTDWSGPVR
jgi:hypothetical protein